MTSRNYRMVPLSQGSAAWLDWRKQGISATESSIVLGLSSRQTPWGLWAQKKGLLQAENLAGNPFVRHGQKYEGVARRVAEQAIGQDILFPVCVENTSHPWLIASLDGIDAQGVPVELKCPSGSVAFDAFRRREDSAFFKRYWPQVQHQIAAVGADRGYLYAVFVDPKETEVDPFVIEFQIERNEAYLDGMIEQCGQFFKDCIRGPAEPEKDPKRDPFVPQRQDEQLIWLDAERTLVPLLEEERSLNQKLKALKARKIPHQEKLRLMLQRSGYQEGQQGALAVRLVTKGGRLDYGVLLDQLNCHPTAQQRAQAKKPDSQELRCRIIASNDVNRGVVRTADPQVSESLQTLSTLINRSMSSFF